MIHSYAATRATLAIALANLATFAAMLYIGPISWTPYVYFAALLLSGALVCKIKFRGHACGSDNVVTILIFVSFCLLTIPRTTYLADWLPDLVVATHSDDYARVLQILAMTGDGSYPLQSPSNSQYPFSFYYASLYPFALFKLLVPGVTIKFSIAAVSAALYGLLLLSMVEVSRGILRDRVAVRAFVFCVTLFGGLDWLASGDLLAPYGHFEWWQRRLDGNTQISSAFTAMFWTPHHFFAAYSAILAYFVLFYSWSKEGTRLKIPVVSLLLGASFYASPFSFLPAALLVAMHARVFLRTDRILIAILVALLLAPPLELFLSKFPSEGFVPSSFLAPLSGLHLVDKVLSFPLYVLLVPIIELAGIPIVLLMIWRSLHRRERILALGAWIYFISTYFIAYSGANNYSMRGMIVPSFIFFFMFSNHIRRLIASGRTLSGAAFTPTVLVLATLLSIGTLKESLHRFASAVGMTNIIHKTFAPLPPLYETASNPDITSLHISEISGIPRPQIYDFEKTIEGLPLEDMQAWEKELIRKPWNEAGEPRTACWIRIGPC